MYLHNKNMTNKHFFKKCIFLVSLCIIFLSVGFASFSNNLTVEGASATIRVNADMRIKSITVKEISKDVSVSYTDFNVKNTSTGITLPYSDSYAIFDVDIVNLGNVEMGIATIFGSNPELKYEIVNNDYISDGFKPYSLKERLCDDANDSKCKLGTESHILVKVSYKNLELYNSSSKYFDVNLAYYFKRIYKIEYTDQFLSLLTGNPVRYITEDDDILIGVNLSDINAVKISSSYTLNKNIDYFFENNNLSIKNIQDDILIDLSQNFDYNEEIGVSVSAEFISDREAIITLNGSNTDFAIFIKVYPNDVEITNNASTFYDPKWVGTDATIYKKGKSMFMSYEYIDGSVVKPAVGKAFTIKYRDTTTSCAGINSIPELVTNHSKNQFDMLSTGFSSGELTKDAVDFISVYADIGYTFNNFKFKVKYGEQS